MTSLFAPENAPFAAALILMLGLGLGQLAGLSGAVDADGEGHGAGPLAWLGVGRVPLMVVLLLLAFVFGVLGFAGQRIAAAVLGAPVSAWLAGPLAFALALPLTRAAARFVGDVFPEIETSAVETEALIGRHATIVVGRAAQGAPARARVVDAFGQAHFVMVEPDDARSRFEEAEEVLLVRRERHLFRAIATGAHLLPRSI